MGEWKNVIDERPDVGQHVLVTNGEEVRMGYIGASGYSGPYDPRIGWMTLRYFDLDRGFFPTHWMPLPEVPSQGEVENVNSASDAIVEKILSEARKKGYPY